MAGERVTIVREIESEYFSAKLDQGGAFEYYECIGEDAAGRTWKYLRTIFTRESDGETVEYPISHLTPMSRKRGWGLWGKENK